MCTMSLHVEGNFVAATKMWEGYAWKVDWETLNAYKLHMEDHKNSNMKFIKILSTSWCGAVDQD